MTRLENGLNWSFSHLPPLDQADFNDPVLSERLAAIIDRFTKFQDQFAGAMRHAFATLSHSSAQFKTICYQQQLLSSNG